MKNTKFIAIALACAGLFSANAAFAGERNNCRQDQNTAGAVGGFLGAGAGAAAGRAIAASSVRPEGVILGTVVGAIIGAKVGNNTVDCSDDDFTQAHGRSYGEASYGDEYYNEGRRESHRNAMPSQRRNSNHQHHSNHGHHNHGDVQTGYTTGSSYYESNGWYVPSSESYYGQERRVIYYNNPAPQYNYAPAVQYPAVQYNAAPVIVQQWTTGPDYVPAPVQYAPQYMPAPQYAPAPGVGCGQWVCNHH